MESRHGIAVVVVADVAVVSESSSCSKCCISFCLVAGVVVAVVVAVKGLFLEVRCRSYKLFQKTPYRVAEFPLLFVDSRIDDVAKFTAAFRQHFNIVFFREFGPEAHSRDQEIPVEDRQDFFAA